MANTDLTIQDFGINYQPPILTISNYNALKQQLDEMLQDLNGLVVTEENFKSADKTQANLKKLKDQLNDKRKQVKREYNIPYNEFKRDVDGLISQVDQVYVPIKSKVDEIKDQQREKRKQHVLELINEMAGKYGVKPKDVPFDSKWANKSLSEIQRTRDIADALKTLKHEQDLAKANQQLIIEYAKNKGMSETDSWLQLLASGKDVQEVKALIDQSAQKEIEDEKRKQKQKEAEEAIAKATHVTTPDGKVVDTTTGEVVAEHYLLVLAIEGTGKELRTLLDSLDQKNTAYTIISNKEVK